MLNRVLVVLTSIVTWLAFAGIALTIAVEELLVAGVADGSPVIRVLGYLVVAIGTVVSIVRRVSPAIPGTEGLLPSEN